MDDHTKQFGAWLRRARRARGISQVKLAAQVGCTHGTLLKWEKGDHSISFARLVAVTRALGYKVSISPQ
jgi:transcriptional regulator with XRE-family HTH domain